MPSQLGIKHGMDVLNIENDEIAPKRIQMGRYMIVWPRSDEAGDSVSPCGPLTNSKDQPHATFICRLLQNAAARKPTQSIREFEFEKLPWPGSLDTEPSNRHTNRTVHRLLTFKKNVNVGTVEEDKKYLNCPGYRKRNHTSRKLYAISKKKTDGVATDSRQGHPGLPEQRKL